MKTNSKIIGATFFTILMVTSFYILANTNLEVSYAANEYNYNLTRKNMVSHHYISDTTCSQSNAVNCPVRMRYGKKDADDAYVTKIHAATTMLIKDGSESTSDKYLAYFTRTDGQANPDHQYKLVDIDSISSTMEDASKYTSNADKFKVILKKVYPYVSLSEMLEFMENDIGSEAYQNASMDNLDVQEAISGVQAAILNIFNDTTTVKYKETGSVGILKNYSWAGATMNEPRYIDSPYFAKTLDKNGNKIGNSKNDGSEYNYVDWDITGDNSAYVKYYDSNIYGIKSTVYQTGDIVDGVVSDKVKNYQTDSGVQTRINTVVDWLLSLDTDDITKPISLSLSGTSNSSSNQVEFEIKTINGSFEDINNLQISLTDSNSQSISSSNISIKDKTENDVIMSKKITVSNLDYNTTYLNVKVTGTQKELPDGASVFTCENDTCRTYVTYTAKPFTIDQTIKVNYSLDKPSLILTKVDSETNNHLSGAELTVKDEKSNIVATWLTSSTSTSCDLSKVGNNNGCNVVKELTPGKYTIIETVTPSGYATMKPFEVTVGNDGLTTSSLVMKNSPIKVCINKIDSNSKFLEGATIQLLKDNKLIEEFISTTTSKCFIGLEIGKYTIKEIKAPDGYQISDPIEIEVKDMEETQDHKVINEINVPKTDLNTSHIILIFVFVFSILGLFTFILVPRKK